MGYSVGGYSIFHWFSAWSIRPCPQRTTNLTLASLGLDGEAYSQQFTTIHNNSQHATKCMKASAILNSTGTGFGQMPRERMSKSASFFGNGKVYEQNSPAAPGRAAMEDENLKQYQDGVYGGRHANVESSLEDAVYGALAMFVEVNGVSDAEAAEMVLEEVKNILGL